MKKTLITILLISINSTLLAQEELPYKPLSEFGTDTTAFFRYNFIDRENYYIGKSMDDVIDDIQIPIVNVGISVGRRIRGVYGLYLDVCDEARTTYLRENKTNVIYSIHIEWKGLIPYNDEIDKLENSKPEASPDKILDYFRPIGRKIKAVTLIPIDDSGYYLRHSKHKDGYPIQITRLNGDTLMTTISKGHEHMEGDTMTIRWDLFFEDDE